MVEMCLVVEWSGFQMPFKNLTKFKMSGFKIFPVFECFRISNDQFSDPHCIHICVTSLMNVHLPHNAEHSSFFVGAHSIFWLFKISFWSWPWTVTAALTLGFRAEKKWFFFKPQHYGFPQGQNLKSYFLKFKIWVHYIKIYSIWSKNSKAFTLVSKTNKDMTLLSVEGEFSTKKLLFVKKWNFN